jgi:hypothetical protein
MLTCEWTDRKYRFWWKVYLTGANSRRLRVEIELATCGLGPTIEFQSWHRFDFWCI